MLWKKEESCPILNVHRAPALGHNRSHSCGKALNRLSAKLLCLCLWTGFSESTSLSDIQQGKAGNNDGDILGQIHVLSMYFLAVRN